MQKITTFLWFDTEAEEAVTFYTSVFRNSRILSITRNGAQGPGPAGTPLVISFQLEGQEFAALNGGPAQHFTPAISLFVSCETQREVDELWDRLCAGGGAPMACGWLTDRFGLCWQIVPSILVPMLQDRDPVRAQRVMAAMMTMVKLDIAALQRAHDGT